MINSDSTWLVVAQKAKARVYEMDQSKAVHLIQEFNHPSGKLKAQEMESDRPGRSFSSAGSSRHGFTQENGPKEQNAIDFSKQIADFLEKSRNEHRFGSLQLVAGPSFLGSLRNEMTPQICGMITSELDKNLNDFSESELTEYMRKL